MGSLSIFRSIEPKQLEDFWTSSCPCHLLWFPVVPITFWFWKLEKVVSPSFLPFNPSNCFKHLHLQACMKQLPAWCTESNFCFPDWLLTHSALDLTRASRKHSFKDGKMGWLSVQVWSGAGDGFLVGRKWIPMMMAKKVLNNHPKLSGIKVLLEHKALAV